MSAVSGPSVAASSSDSPQQALHSHLVDPEKATPMVKQFLEVKKDHPGVILFYRMGDFYETFFEDAIICARVLEITLTGREAGALGRIPMAGVPVKAYEAYLNKLLAQQFKVAICEQLEASASEEATSPTGGKGLMPRKVVRVLSSGTLTEQSLLAADRNNYLAALVLPKKPGEPCGLAYCDISTGRFLATELTEEQLFSELNRIQPAELLVPGRRKKMAAWEGVSEMVPDVPAALLEAYPCTPITDAAFDTATSEKTLLSLMQVATLEGFGLAELPKARQAAGAVGYYLKETFLDTLPVLEGIRTYRLSQCMALNQSARRNLELHTTCKTNSYEGSLYWVLNQTQTSMGARLLRDWISQPLTHLPEINSRLEAVEELLKNSAVRDSLKALLANVYDLERLGTKVANGTAMPRDLVALKQSIGLLPQVANLLKGCNSFYLSRLQTFPPELFKLVALVDQTLSDAPGLHLKEGNLIKPGHHAELDRLCQVIDTHTAWLQAYETEEREKTGLKTLKIAFNSAFGYYIEISRAQADKAPAHYHRKQTLTQAERFTTDALKKHEADYLDAQSRRFDLEYQLFLALRGQLIPYGAVVKDCAHRVAAVDVLRAFADVSAQQGYVRPLVDESLDINIQQGRHPVVEKMLPLGQFVPNDCVLSAAPQEIRLPQVMLISGPNMAGKSTFMRQVAMIVVMAQMGCFVPAAYARIGLVDSIYTRIGAVDDVTGGQSTFMVEMNETAQILNGGTHRSLVILDEIGRGTSTYDGISIAWSVVEYLVSALGSRTLFATHYHELNVLEKQLPKVHNYRVCVSEQQGSSTGPASGDICFLHKVEPGAAQKSYGIQVAKMAGLPAEVIRKANTLLNTMQKKDISLPSAGSKGYATDEDALPTPQLSLF